MPKYEGDYKCFCGDSFNSEDGLDYHVERDHPDD